jgi:hypothetical protein
VVELKLPLVQAVLMQLVDRCTFLAAQHQPELVRAVLSK